MLCLANNDTSPTLFIASDYLEQYRLPVASRLFMPIWLVPRPSSRLRVDEDRKESRRQKFRLPGPVSLSSKRSRGCIKWVRDGVHSYLALRILDGRANSP